MLENAENYDLVVTIGADTADMLILHDALMITYKPFGDQLQIANCESSGLAMDSGISVAVVDGVPLRIA